MKTIFGFVLTLMCACSAFGQTATPANIFGLGVSWNQSASTSASQQIAGTATWFWTTHKLNALADVDDLTGITRRINGSTETVPQRQACLADAKRLTMSQGYMNG